MKPQKFYYTETITVLNVENGVATYITDSDPTPQTGDYARIVEDCQKVKENSSGPVCNVEVELSAEASSDKVAEENKASSETINDLNTLKNRIEEQINSLKTDTDIKDFLKGFNKKSECKCNGKCKSDNTCAIRILDDKEVQEFFNGLIRFLS